MDGMMEKKEVVIRVRPLAKDYQLGVIGRGTLQREFQSWWAKKRGKEDPNEKIGQSHRTEEGHFYALEDISFDIYKGERIGVIGANGAGKSTLFKLLARVTAPTKGAIGIKGRISSMLEVGTGFHAELTGRENIYLNGAILGMKRGEVDEKIEDIIAFSECETFIDTPVKRYSSGMYVKLAFAVAAHLNSEILLMDEVLAVGDMKFQKKCLEKMTELSEDEQKTILYVSHNMETIRTLCDRCIVLDSGKIIFDGDTEQAIAVYLGSVVQMKQHYTYNEKSDLRKTSGKLRFCALDFKGNPAFAAAEGLTVCIHYQVKEKIEDLHIRLTIHNQEQQVIGTSVSESLGELKKDSQKQVYLRLDTKMLAKGVYTAELAAVEPLGQGRQIRDAWLEHAFAFEITEDAFSQYRLNWPVKQWGYTVYPDLEVLDDAVSTKGV